MKSFLPNRLEDRELLHSVLKLSQKNRIKVYLVGGYLRDIFLKREKKNPDMDFCLKKGAIGFARKLARQIKGGFVVLDREHGASRVVKKICERAYTLDFTDFRGKDIEDDLLHRDFTINTFCVDLGDFLNAGIEMDKLLIDPYRGRDDLKLKSIKVVNKKAFDEDPLRILRAFSLSSIFGFRIDKDTLRLIKLKGRHLTAVSFERIRDELFKILEQPGSFNYFVMLDKLGILKIIFPEIEAMRGVAQGPYHHLDIWKHTLETLRQLEIVLEEFKKHREIRDYLNESIAAGRCRYALMKLGAFLHDIGKPKARRRKNGKIKFHGHERIGLDITKIICQRLKLSNDEKEALGKMVMWHLRPGYLADSENPTARAKFRYFRDTEKEAVSTLLISLADQRSTRGRLTSKEARQQHERVGSRLINEYFVKSKQKKLTRLVTGDDLIAKFKLAPSPLIGKVLREIEELQAIGKVKTKKDALTAAGKIILKEK